MEIYKNGELIFAETGHPNTFNDASGPYFKQGLYVFGPTRPGRVDLYSTGLKIGDGNESLATMAGMSTSLPEPDRISLLLCGLVALLPAFGVRLHRTGAGPSCEPGHERASSSG
jgi:hypothetical protein